jgi:hypothetical protein
VRTNGNPKASKKVTVVLAFEYEVEGKVDADTVGQILCQSVVVPKELLRPAWSATPNAVGFIRAQFNEVERS